jgi:hypothetical protein
MPMLLEAQFVDNIHLCEIKYISFTVFSNCLDNFINRLLFSTCFRDDHKMEK